MAMAAKLTLLLALCLFAAAVSARAVRDDSSSSPTSFTTISSSTENPPADEPSSPAYEPSSPADEPSSPADEPSSPADEPSSPADEPSSPADEPTSPADEPSSPADEPSSPEGPTDTPYTKPTAIPDGIPKSCAERPAKNDYLMIPEPTSCTKFIVCSGHQQWILDCPGGTYFSYNKQLCDWPWLTDCEEPED